MIHNHSPPRKGLYVGRKVSFAVADGSADYEVIRINEKTVRLKWVGGYRYMLLGAEGNAGRSVIEALVEADDTFAAILSPANKPN
jgi:Fe-S oxidoreductase